MIKIEELKEQIEGKKFKNIVKLISESVSNQDEPWDKEDFKPYMVILIPWMRQAKDEDISTLVRHFISFSGLIMSNRDNPPNTKGNMFDWLWFILSGMMIADKSQHFISMYP